MTFMRLLLFIGSVGIVMTGCADARKKGSPGIEFVLVDKRHLEFRITNHTKRTVELEDIFCSPDSPYYPAYPTFQYLNGRGRWENTMDASGDHPINHYPLKPGTSVQFKLHPVWVEDLKKEVNKGTLLRVKNGDLYSEPFRW